MRPQPSLTGETARGAGAPGRNGPETRRLRVLWLADKLGYGDFLHGLGHYFLNVLPSLTEHVDVIAVVCRASEGLADTFRLNGIPLRVLNYSRFNPRTLAALTQLIRTEQVDLLQLHGHGSSMLGRLAGLLTHTPVIIRQGDFVSAPWYVQLGDWLLGPLTVRAIAVSESVKHFCVRHRSLPASRIIVMPNGVKPIEPTTQQELGQWRQALRLPEKAKLLGSITRFHPIKGVEYLIEAMPLVVKAQPNAYLVLWGDGPQQAALQARAGELGISEHIRFDGYRSDARKRLPLLDCFVLPSISEGSPNALLEAMMAGRAIVATRTGGVGEIVQDGQEALLVAPRDAQALGEAIVRELSDEALAGRLSRCAQEASARYAMNAHTLALARLYSEVARES